MPAGAGPGQMTYYNNISTGYGGIKDNSAPFMRKAVQPSDKAGESGKQDNASIRLDNSHSGSISEVKKEIEGMKAAIEDLQNKGWDGATGITGKMLFYLKNRSIHEDLALRLCEKAASLKDVASSMAKEIKTYGGADKKVVMVIGPTGVGKTTTIAKLAARAIKNGRKAAMISLDTYRIGAIEQIRIYSRIMGVPLDIVPDTSGLRKSLAKYADRDMIFIDTTGRNPRDEGYISELAGIYDLEIPVSTHLLMSANSDENFMSEAYKRYSRLRIDCLSFTKMDEAVKLGAIYNLCSTYKKPVGYLTTGQRVPQDIEFPNSVGLALKILTNGVS